MKFFNKIKEKMCMSKTSAVLGFRVTLRSDPSLRKGICCTSLEELRQKIGKKFPDCSHTLPLFTDDGTEVDDDDYLMSLPPQSLLVVGKAPVSGPTPENIFDRLLTLLRESSGASSVYNEVLDFMAEDFQQKWDQMHRSIKADDELTRASSREEHPAWFADLSTNAHTKEEFMNKNCQARVRGYLAKAETQLKEEKFSEKQELLVQQMVKEFKTRLKAAKYHGTYFDRSSEKKRKICDDTGLFRCEGKYNSAQCCYPKDHIINPYQSAEARVLFSTWNLDHLVERSRSVVPSIISALKGTKTSRQKINTDYFYSLLFTRSNLKLVHIVCHDKGCHKGKVCDRTKFYQ